MLDRKKPLDHAFVESMRERIELATIIDKFQNHVRDADKYPMSSTQLKAGEVLLRKVMPDLISTELKGDIRHHDVSDKPLSDDEWSRAYGAESATH